MSHNKKRNHQGKCNFLKKHLNSFKKIVRTPFITTLLQEEKGKKEKVKRLTCIHKHGDEKSNQMDPVFGINAFGSQDGQLENDGKEQFYAERLHLCSLHGAAAAL